MDIYKNWRSPPVAGSAGYTPKTQLGKPFTEEDLADVPEEVREQIVAIVNERFPQNRKLTANAMLGMYAIIMRTLERFEEVNK